MKQSNLAIFFMLFSCAFFNTSVMAASQTTLQVRGELKPSPCDVDFDGGGILDWGVIDPASLSPVKDVQLTPKFTTLNISCAVSTLLLITSTDNAPGAGDVTLDGEKKDYYFSLGKTNAGAIIGGYTAYIVMTNSLVNGGRLQAILYGTDINNLDSTTHNRPMYPVDITRVAAGNGQNTTPIRVRALSLPLEVQPWIAAMNTLGSDTILLDGNATFELIYL